MINNKRKNKNAFTLAEVLLTLTILGVVAAITIPLIQNTIPSTNKALFRKSYLTLQRAIENMLNDEVIYPSEITTNSGGFTYQRGFNYTTDPTSAAGTKNKFCYYLAQELNLNGSAICPEASPSTLESTKFATTTDGVDWYIWPGSTSASTQMPLSGDVYMTRLLVDVNGSKKPNCFSDTSTSCTNMKPATHTCSCTNSDTFIIGVRFDGKIRAGISSAVGTNEITTDQKALDILKEPLDNSK